MSRKRIPLAEGLVNEEGKGGILRASYCSGCGKVYFPARAVCPECGGEEFSGIFLPDEGLLYTYTAVHMPSEHYRPPYTIGWVEFKGGVRVFGLIDAAPDDVLEIGMVMKTEKAVLWSEEEHDVEAYRFKPVFKQSVK